MAIIMAEWKQLSEEAARQKWDRQLIKFADCSPYQTYSWGQYQKTLGWEPCYFVAESDDGNVAAMFLGLLRRYPLKTGFMWCTGGPIGDFKTWDENLPKTVLKAINLKRLHVRFRCDSERDPQMVLFLKHRNWKQSISTITSNVSMELDLSVAENDFSSKLSRNWRRNLAAARENNLVVKLCANPDVEEIYQVYSEMEKRKNLPPQFSKEKLENIFKSAGSNLIFYRCEDASGNLLCFRGCLTIGDRAGDYLAATTENGVKQRASYLTLWQLLKDCRERGIKLYDLGGIDPWENPGVYRFKKETGAREIEYLGEWDWANTSWLRLLGNLAISQKQKIKKVNTGFVSNYINRGWLTRVYNSLKPELKMPGIEKIEPSRFQNPDLKI
jgi:hypothetical protein